MVIIIKNKVDFKEKIVNGDSHFYTDKSLIHQNKNQSWTFNIKLYNFKTKSSKIELKTELKAEMKKSILRYF